MNMRLREEQRRATLGHRVSMGKEAVIGVAVVEDDVVTRQMLERLIKSDPGCECIGAFEVCEDALAHFLSEQPDVVLMDIALPGMSGIDGVRRISAAYPDTRVIMLTAYQDDEKIFQSICAGACGYLLKQTPRESLLNAIQEVHTGGAPMNAGIARRVLELFRKTSAPLRSDSVLTQREIDLLQALVDGCSYKMVADRLGISIDTVRNHIRHTYDKLHVHSKSEAVAKALKDRLV